MCSVQVGFVAMVDNPLYSVCRDFKRINLYYFIEFDTIWRGQGIVCRVIMNKALEHHRLCLKLFEFASCPLVGCCI